jgi:hypothetical protein
MVGSIGSRERKRQPPVETALLKRVPVETDDRPFSDLDRPADDRRCLSGARAVRSRRDAGRASSAGRRARPGGAARASGRGAAGDPAALGRARAVPAIRDLAARRQDAAQASARLRCNPDPPTELAALPWEVTVASRAPGGRRCAITRSFASGAAAGRAYPAGPLRISRVGAANKAGSARSRRRWTTRRAPGGACCHPTPARTRADGWPAHVPLYPSRPTERGASAAAVRAGTRVRPARRRARPAPGDFAGPQGDTIGVAATWRRRCSRPSARVLRTARPAVGAAAACYGQLAADISRPGGTVGRRALVEDGAGRDSSALRLLPGGERFCLPRAAAHHRASAAPLILAGAGAALWAGARWKTRIARRPCRQHRPFYWGGPTTPPLRPATPRWHPPAPPALSTRQPRRHPPPAEPSRRAIPQRLPATPPT